MWRPTYDTWRTVRRGLAYIAGGLLAFSVALVLLFPYGRAKDRIARVMSLWIGGEVEIADAGPTFGMGISLRDVKLSWPPSTPGAKPTRVFVEKARIGLSPLAMLLGGSSVGVTADVFSGRIKAERAFDKTHGSFALVARDIDLADVPGIRESINLPAAGTLEVELDLRAPIGKLAEAQGAVSLRCAGCALGDGKEKLKVAGNPLLAEGLSLPRLRIGDLAGKATIDKGTVRFQGIEAKSPDGELVIEGELTLRDPWPQSTFRAYVRFRFTDAFLARAEKVKVLLQLAESQGKRPDGFFGLRISGRPDHLDMPEWSKLSPFSSSGPIAPGAGRSGSTLGRSIGPGRSGVASIATARPAVETGEPPPPTTPQAFIESSPTPMIPPPPPPPPDEPPRAEQAGRPMGATPAGPIMIGLDGVRSPAPGASPAAFVPSARPSETPAPSPTPGSGETEME